MATLAANAFSRSRPERRLWTPVIALMLICLIAVLVLDVQARTA